MAYLYNDSDPDLDQLSEQIGDIIKIGVVSSVDSSTNTARVTFPDRDDLVSNDLQVLQRNTGQNKDLSYPDVKENVLCLFLGTGEENGFILGSFYNQKNQPPENNQELRVTKYSDGTEIRYNRKTHEMEIKAVGTVKIEAAQKTVLQSSTQIDLEAPIINLNAQSINFNATGECNGISSGPFRIQAPRIELN